MRRVLLPLLVTLLPATVLGACTYFRGAPAPYRPPPSYRTDYPTDAATLDIGEHLFARDCAFCHGHDARGTDRAPDLTVEPNGPALTDFMLRTGRMPIPEPDTPSRRRPPVYDEREIDAIVAYLDVAIGQPGPGIPNVDPRAGDLAEGQDVYSENCAACHASTGIGGAMLADEDGRRTGVHIPDLFAADAEDVAQAVRTGPGAMPRFGEGVISDQELNSLARYVQHLHRPDDRGGWPIGRIGPVAEGAAGWILGLGALAVFIRWVGTKRGELR